MRKISIFLPFLFSNFLFASFDMNERMKKSYLHIMNLEFAQAQHIINKEKEFKNNGITVLHENYIDFLTIIINEEKSYFLDKDFI